MSICLTGAHVADTAQALAVRLTEMDRSVEVIDAASVRRFGSVSGAAHGCDLLARNGVVVVVTAPGVRPEGACLDIEVDGHDTPEFAAEKIVDVLAEAGVIALEIPEHSAEDEAKIQERLAALGYVE